MSLIYASFDAIHIKGVKIGDYFTAFTLSLADKVAKDSCTAWKW